jgi:hypothetical protein
MISKNFVACILLMVAANALADQSTKDAKLNELMRLQGLTEMIEQQQAYCQEQARAIGPKMIAEFKKQIPEIDQAVLDEVDAALSAFVDSAKPSWTVGEAATAWSNYYGEQLTEEELDQIIAFYRSPIGQKDILATRKAMPGWSAFFGERNQKVLESAMNAYVERLKAIVQNARAKKSGA